MQRILICYFLVSNPVNSIFVSNANSCSRDICVWRFSHTHSRMEPLWSEGWLTSLTFRSSFVPVAIIFSNYSEISRSVYSTSSGVLANIIRIYSLACSALCIPWNHQTYWVSSNFWRQIILSFLVFGAVALPHVDLSANQQPRSCSHHELFDPR